MTQHIVGVWHLDAFHDVDEAGRPVGEGPLGPAPSGMLIYTPDGHVSVSMMPTGHSAAQGPSYMGYAGEWWEQDGKVVHRIHISSRRDWIGVEQSRDAELDGDVLTVRATREVDARPQRRVLVWRRADRSGGAR
ncbi:lipocalin-like domain-containing protein [Streptomyces griseorubiginosus]|uniref:lipocalin-like domain-containing protein n=1 Tax=Streptomyces griseorubiginosus TaxID=67304 RepID=UPI00113FD236|nr:lipocalin-like domain-containing protein [Streptomyces griseorubiginosus]